MRGELGFIDEKLFEINKGSALTTIPDPPNSLYKLLYNEVTWVHLKWKDFRTLFVHSPERINFLNEVAPDFFGNLQRMMWEDVALHLCRLTDPPQSMGHDNLTLRRFPAEIVEQPLFSEVQSLVEVAKAKTDFARDWRNRRLAHLELDKFIKKYELLGNKFLITHGLFQMNSYLLNFLFKFNRNFGLFLK